MIVFLCKQIWNSWGKNKLKSTQWKAHQKRNFKAILYTPTSRFVKKYPVRQQDKDLYESYKPVDAFSNTLEEQVSALSHSVPQCVLCPINSGNVEKISLDKKKVMP